MSFFEVSIVWCVVLGASTSPYLNIFKYLLITIFGQFHNFDNPYYKFDSYLTNMCKPQAKFRCLFGSIE